MTEKKKLTLSVDAGVLEKAKELGLNLSQITEQALELTTLSNEKEIVTQKELRIAYKEIFHLLQKVLEEWGTSIEIGSYLDFIDKQETDLQEFSYNLNSHGIFRWNDIVEGCGHWNLEEDFPVDSLYDPNKIIENLIEGLHKKGKQNKEKLNQLRVMKNILELSGLAKS